MNGRKPDLWTPALIGGTFLGVTSAIPILEYLNCACCMLVIGGGLLSSYLYLKRYPPELPPVTYGEGALLGLLTGVVGGVVWTLVGVPLQYIKMQLGTGVDELAQIQEALSDPRIPEGVGRILEGLFEGGLLSVGMILISVVRNFVISTIFATLGGILGIALFQKKSVPAATSPPPPSEAPPLPPGENPKSGENSKS